MDDKWQYLNDNVEGYGYYRWLKEHFQRYSMEDKYVSIRQEDAAAWENVDARKLNGEQRRRLLNHLLNQRLTCTLSTTSDFKS